MQRHKHSHLGFNSKIAFRDQLNNNISGSTQEHFRVNITIHFGVNTITFDSTITFSG